MGKKQTTYGIRAKLITTGENNRNDQGQKQKAADNYSQLKECHHKRKEKRMEESDTGSRTGPEG